jgi:hypothetical protein
MRIYSARRRNFYVCCCVADSAGVEQTKYLRGAVYIHAGGAGQERERVCIVLVPAAAHTRTPGPHCRDIKLNLQRSLFAPGASSLSLSRTHAADLYTHTYY